MKAAAVIVHSFNLLCAGRMKKLQMKLLTGVGGAEMKDRILQHALKLPPWALLLTTVVLSEVFTLGMNAVNSYIWWKRIDRDLLFIGTIDAAVVSGLVGGILIFLLHQLRIREAIIQEEKGKKESIISALGDELCILDKDFHIQYQNTSHIREHGVLFGQTCYEAVHRFREFCEGCPSRLAFQSGKAEKTEQVFMKDGKLHYYEVTSSPVHDSSGTITGVVEIVRDITDKQELQRKEESLSRAQSVARMGSWEWDIATNEVRWSREVFNIYGLDPMTCKPEYSIVVGTMHPDSLDEFVSAVDAALNENTPFEMDYSLTRPNGEVRTVHTKGEVIFDDSGQPVQMMGTVLDITERKKYEQEMHKLAVITEQSAEGIALTDMDGKITFANQAWASMHGYKPKELIGRHLRMFHNKAQLEEEVIPFNEIVFEKGHHSGEVGHIRQDGSVFYTHMTTTLLRDPLGRPYGIVGSATDITERKLLEAQLRQSVKDKDMLIKEINHRVKNNLAVITSLLRLQSRSLDDEKARGLFMESENRIRAMSMIHERLSGTEDLRSIDFGEYLRSLVAQLFDVYRNGNANIRLVTNIEDVTLDVSQVVPCALIVNELVTNSMKYAFPRDLAGEVRVALSQADEKGYCLSVSDSGIGIPEHIDIGSATSMGLTIVQALTAQLGATIQLDRSAGTAYRVEFSEKTLV